MYLCLVIKRFWVFVFLSVILQVMGQQDSLKVDTGIRDSVQRVQLSIQDYRWRTEQHPFRPIDIELDREKKYIYTHPEHEDEWGRLRLPNLGQGYNPTLFRLRSGYRLAPENQIYGWLSPQQVRYYDVKTPYIRLIHHSGIKNGSALQGLYSQNIHSRWNISFDYFGLRSQGAYQRSLSNNDHLSLTSHYQTESGGYAVEGHYFQQYRRNEQSGGIQNVEAFLDVDPRFNDRQNFVPNLYSVSSIYAYRRGYVLQRLGLVSWRDWFWQGYHRLNFQQEEYTYFQTGEEAFFPSFNLTNFLDETQKYLHRYGNEVGVEMKKGRWKLDLGLSHELRKFGSREPIFLNSLAEVPAFSEHRLGLVGGLEAGFWSKMKLISRLKTDYGSQLGSFIESRNHLDFLWKKDVELQLDLDWRYTAPRVNFLLNSSPLQAYNYLWLGLGHESSLFAAGKLMYKPFGLSTTARLMNIRNYTYVDAGYQIRQSAPGVGVLQVSGDWAFRRGRWHADTQVAFQHVVKGGAILPLPNFILRAQGYWQGMVLRNSSELQAGATVYYTSGFNSRMLFPVLNEWALSSFPQRVAGYPDMDLFTHLKVKRFFIFLEAKQFSTLFLKNKVLVAPFFPQDDFRLNLGIVWHILN